MGHLGVAPVFSFERRRNVIDLPLKPVRAFALSISVGDPDKVGSRLLEGNLQPVVCKRVRDGGDEFVVPGSSGDERHVRDPACLVKISAATLLGCGFLTAALLSDIHSARDRRARKREADTGCGFLGQWSTHDQESHRSDGKQQDRPQVRKSHGCRIAALEFPRLGPVLLRHVAIIGDHCDPRLRLKR